MPVTPSPTDVEYMYIRPNSCLLSSSEKFRLILLVPTESEYEIKVQYLDFYRWVINLSGVKGVHMSRIEELVTTSNRGAENDVFLRQLPQSRPFYRKAINN